MELLNQLPFKQSVVVKGNAQRERAGERASVKRLAEVAASNVRKCKNKVRQIGLDPLKNFADSRHINC